MQHCVVLILQYRYTSWPEPGEWDMYAYVLTDGMNSSPWDGVSVR